MTNITSTGGSAPSEPEVLVSRRAILAGTKLFTLATVDAEFGTWVNTAWFSFLDDGRLFFLSEPSTRHAKNLAQDSRASATIFDSQQLGDNGKAGLQLAGTCNLATGSALAAGLGAFQERFAGFDEVIAAPEDFDRNIIQSRLYEFTPQRSKIFDEARFGEEVWVTMEHEWPQP